MERIPRGRMRTLLALLSALFFALVLVGFDTIEFDEPVYDYICDGTTEFSVTVRYFGPHIVSTWVWFEYPDELEVQWQNILPGSAWHTEWNEYNVQCVFIGPGPGSVCDNRLIVWMYDWDYGADGDGKPIFDVTGIIGNECYEGEIAAMLDERTNRWGAQLHDILTIGEVRGFPSTERGDRTWGAIKAMYR